MIKSISKVFLVSLIGMLVFTSLPQRSAIAQTVDDETLIHQTIDAYFNLKYEARADLNPRAFGHLIASTSQAQRFLRGELDRREIEYHRAKLFGLGYAEYSYTLDYLSIVIDAKAETSDIKLIESQDVQFQATAPVVSSMRIDHTFTLVKVKDQWKIVEDLYADLYVRMMNEGLTKAEMMQINRSNYQEWLEQKQKYSTNAGQRNELMSGHSINRQGAHDYAYQYWEDYNDDFFDFVLVEEGSDCANFVSQALREGGDVGETTHAPDRSGWWYVDGISLQYATAWSGAHWFYNFAVNQQWQDGGPEGSMVSNVFSLSKGDTILYEGSGDYWKWDHIVIVMYSTYPWVFVNGHDPDQNYYPYQNNPWRTGGLGIGYLHLSGW